MKSGRGSARGSVFLLALLLGGSLGCTLAPRARTPIPSQVLRPVGAPGCLAVLLPGRWNRMDAFRKAGFAARAREAGPDLGPVAVDAHIGYDRQQSLARRLEELEVGVARGVCLVIASIIMQTTLSTRWQTVVPREVREALGLAPRAKLAWEVRGGVAVVVPIPEDPVLGSLGILRGPGLTTEDLLEERRRERRREEAADREQGFGLHGHAGEEGRPDEGRLGGGRP